MRTNHIRRRVVLFLASALTAAGLLAACSSDDGPTKPAVVTELLRRTVGPAGDTLILPDELALEIPAGALATDIEITISTSNAAPPRGLGKTYEFAPDGQVFASSPRLTLRIPVDDLGVNTLPEEVRLFTRPSTEWSEVPGSVGELDDTEAGAPVLEVSVLLQHFSPYAAATLEQTQVLFGVYGFAQDSAVGFGRNGVVAIYDGTDVSALAGRISGVLTDGWGLDLSSHLAVGYDGEGRIWSWDGNNYTVVGKAGRTTSGRAMRAIDGDDLVVVAVGNGGRVFVDDGTGFTEPTDPAVTASEADLLTVKCFGGGEAVAAGNEVCLVRSGGVWLRRDLDLITSNRLFLRSVWGVGPADYYLAGFEEVPGEGVVGRLYHCQGSWPPSPVGDLPGNPGRLHGVWGDADDLYVVGEGGVFYHRAGGAAWSVEGTCAGETVTFYDVWAADDEILSAVGSTVQGGLNRAVYVHGVDECEVVDTGGGGGTGRTILFDNRTDRELACQLTWTYGVTDGAASLTVVPATVNEDCPEACDTFFRDSSGSGENPTYPWRLKINGGRLVVDLPRFYSRAELVVDQIYHDYGGDESYSGRTRCFAFRNGAEVAARGAAGGNTQTVVLDPGGDFNQLVVESCAGRVHAITVYP
ncbi:MAG: hypothetical protein GY838_04260 [bacterium]|nr:hypothetical protein [bacterium]